MVENKNSDLNNKHSDLNNHDSSELFDNNTQFIVPPFFCDEILSDRLRDIPLKKTSLPLKQQYSPEDTAPVIEDPVLTSKIQNSTKTVTPAIMLDTEFLETQNSSSSDNEHDEAADTTGKIKTKPRKRKRCHCDFCDYSCARSHTLVNHQKKHHPDDFALMRKNKKGKPMPQRAAFGKFDPRVCCVECDCIFKEVSNLHTHQKKFHPEFRKTVRIKKRGRFDKPGDVKDDQENYSHSYYLKCQMCSETFYKETELDEHQQKLHAEYYKLKKTYKEMELEAMKCQICGSQHKSRRDLKVHMQTHTGDYKYRCDHCDIGFTKNHLLKNHLVKHTGEYPYRCRICEKGFRCLKEYLEHSESRHPKLHQELLEKQKIAEKRFGLNWGKKFHDYMKSSVGVVYD